MEKNRRVKVLSIIALTISLCALTIGFAAFSTTLTISSSASVNPSSDNFKIVAYGFIGNSLNELFEFDSYKSLTQARIVRHLSDGTISVTDKFATIDNLTVSAVSIPLSEPGIAGGIYLKIANEGAYDAYFDTSQFDDINIDATCQKTEDSDATQSLVDEACNYISLHIAIIDKNSFEKAQTFGSDSDEFTTAMSNSCFNNKVGMCKLEKDSYLIVQFGIVYSETSSGTPLADGPFVANFDPITFDFTTNSVGFNS